MQQIQFNKLSSKVGNIEVFKKLKSTDLVFKKYIVQHFCSTFFQISIVSQPFLLKNPPKKIT